MYNAVSCVLQLLKQSYHELLSMLKQSYHELLSISNTNVKREERSRIDKSNFNKKRRNATKPGFQRFNQVLM